MHDRFHPVYVLERRATECQCADLGDSGRNLNGIKRVCPVLQSVNPEHDRVRGMHECGITDIRQGVLPSIGHDRPRDDHIRSGHVPVYVRLAFYDDELEREGVLPHGAVVEVAVVDDYVVFGPSSPAGYAMDLHVRRRRSDIFRMVPEEIDVLRSAGPVQPLEGLHGHRDHDGLHIGRISERVGRDMRQRAVAEGRRHEEDVPFEIPLYGSQLRLRIVAGAVAAGTRQLVFGNAVREHDLILLRSGIQSVCSECDVLYRIGHERYPAPVVLRFQLGHEAFGGYAPSHGIQALVQA